MSALGQTRRSGDIRFESVRAATTDIHRGGWCVCSRPGNLFRSQAIFTAVVSLIRFTGMIVRVLATPADAGQHLGEKAMEFIELGAGPPGVRTSTGIRYGLKSEMARGPLPRIDMRTRVSDGRYLNEQSAAERRRLAARIGSRRQRSFRSFGHGYKRRQQ